MQLDSKRDRWCQFHRFVNRSVRGMKREIFSHPGGYLIEFEPSELDGTAEDTISAMIQGVTDHAWIRIRSAARMTNHLPEYWPE